MYNVYVYNLSACKFYNVTTAYLLDRLYLRQQSESKKKKHIITRNNNIIVYTLDTILLCSIII